MYSKWAFNAPVLFNTSFIIIVGYTFCLDGARNYSWLEKNGFPLPGKCLRQLPLALLKICKSCKCCSTKRCVCRKLLGSYTVYCGCAAKCQNIYNIVSE